jgi:hypothetical protein
MRARDQQDHITLNLERGGVNVVADTNRVVHRRGLAESGTRFQRVIGAMRFKRMASA